jgi:predicted DNA-binding antitoxin AbrB/MazE fold protein
LSKTIRARYRNGLIEPLENIDFAEGAEITITVSEPADSSEDGLSRSFGGWKGLIDAEEFLRNVYIDRQASPRQEIKL